MIGLEAEGVVRLDCVVPGVLKLIGKKFVHQADAASFLELVNQNTGPVCGDGLERKVELCAAIASAGSENVAGQTLRMDACERRIFAGKVPPHERDNAFGFI